MATRPPKTPDIDIGRILQNAFRVLIGNIVPFLGVTLVLSVIPTFFLQRWMTAAVGDDPLGMFTSPAYWLSLLAGILGGVILQVMLTRTAIRHLGSAPADFGDALVTAIRLFLPVIFMTIISGFAILIGLIFLIVPGVILYLMWIVAVPVMVEEDRGMIESLARSAELTKGSRLMIFLTVILMMVIASVVGGIFALPLAFGNISDASIAGQAIGGGIGALIGPAMIAALYVELRTVKEGYSLESLASVFD